MAWVYRDITGERFGKLVAIRRAEVRNRNVYWLFACDCGRQRELQRSNVTRGVQKSCGCIKPQKAHGVGGTPEYKAWHSMVARCTDPDHHQYRNYGARGIRVCEQWLSDPAAFVADMGKRPSARHSIDRRNNDGHYEPGNCRWATAKQQGRNTRANTVITWNGKTQCIAEWADELGVPSARISSRFRRGKPLEMVLAP
jgi:hypothetical protein